MINLFLSQYSNKIDKKGRVSLPSSFRSVILSEKKTELILFKSLKFAAIEGCSYQRVEKIAERIENLDIFSDDQDDFSTSIFSQIIPTKLDKEGRFLIPEHLKKHSNISNEATFIGQGYYFQIWEPNAAIEKQKKSRARLIKEKKTLSLILSETINKNEK